MTTIISLLFLKKTIASSEIKIRTSIGNERVIVVSAPVVVLVDRLIIYIYICI